MFTLADHILALLVGVVLPVASARSMAGKDRDEFRLALARDVRLRKAIVQQSTAMQWLITGLVLGATWLRGQDTRALGLSPRGHEPGLLAGYLIAVALAVALMIRARVVLSSPERRHRSLARSAAAAGFLPRTRSEHAGWIWLSITAGFCEEIIYRGFLLAYALAWVAGEFGVPNSAHPAAWAAAVLVSLAFGASHLYQGPRDALKVTLYGSSLSFLYVLSGSLWPSILLHMFVDLHEGRLWTRLLEVEGDALSDAAPADEPAS